MATAHVGTALAGPATSPRSAAHALGRRTHRRGRRGEVSRSGAQLFAQTGEKAKETEAGHPRKEDSFDAQAETDALTSTHNDRHAAEKVSGGEWSVVEQGDISTGGERLGAERHQPVDQ